MLQKFKTEDEENLKIPRVVAKVRNCGEIINAKMLSMISLRILHFHVNTPNIFIGVISFIEKTRA